MPNQTSINSAVIFLQTMQIETAVFYRTCACAIQACHRSIFRGKSLRLFYQRHNLSCYKEVYHSFQTGKGEH